LKQVAYAFVAFMHASRAAAFLSANDGHFVMFCIDAIPV
jgi:hypothetical protein